MKRWWSTGSGRIEIQLPADAAGIGYHSGACDADIAALRRRPDIKATLDTLDAATVRDELREYGAWDAAELADHDANLSRLLWIACGDLAEDMTGERFEQVT